LTKKIYFHIDNGTVIAPFTALPAYCAITKGLKILEIRECYSAANIERNGELWALKEKLKSKEAWSNYRWLMPSLKTFHRINFFNKFPDYEKELAPRFIYVTIWVNNVQ